MAESQRRTNMRRIALTVLLPLLVTACLGSDFTDSIEGSWVLESGTLDGEEIPLPDSHPVTMTVDDGQISGTAACNGYGGEYQVSGSEFEIPEGLAVTEMACNPPEVMDIERQYLDALLGSDKVALANETLTLTGAGVELVFVLPSAEGSSEGLVVNLFGPDASGSWQLISGTLNGVPIPLVESHPVTLDVAGRSLGGRAACNHYGVVFVANGPTEISMTAMACEPDVMESEIAYLAAITRTNDAVVDGDRLVVTGDGVTLTFQRLDPVPAAELLGTIWVLESLVQADAVSSVIGERAALLLNEEGSFEGSTGCRSLAGEYTLSGAEVLFTTMAAEGECPGELTDQDGLVVNVLGDGFRAEVEGDLLSLWSRGDEGLVYRAED